MWLVYYNKLLFIHVLISVTEEIKLFKNKINDVHRYDTPVRINNGSGGDGGREMWVTRGGRNKFKEGLPE